jgi:hypothetical protein
MMEKGNLFPCGEAAPLIAKPYSRGIAVPKVRRNKAARSN